MLVSRDYLEDVYIELLRKTVPHIFGDYQDRVSDENWINEMDYNKEVEAYIEMICDENNLVEIAIEKRIYYQTKKPSPNLEARCFRLISQTDLFK